MKKFLDNVFLIACVAACLFISPAFGEDVSPAGSQPAVELKPRLGGYIEGWYRADESDLSKEASASRKVDNEFRVRRARIDVKGNITDEAGYRVTANFDGPSPASSSSSVKLWDGYITYGVNPFMNITLGQFKYDFSVEGIEGTSDRVPILRSEVVNDIAGKLGTRGGSFRDIGIRVNGEFKDFYGLTYGISLINGNGINIGDNNSDKDIAGRVSITPVKGLTFGVSGYAGRGEEETGFPEVRESAYGMDAGYRFRSGLCLRGEYIAAKWENWDVVTSAADSAKTQKPNIFPCYSFCSKSSTLTPTWEP